MSDLIGKVIGPYQVLLRVRSTPTNVIYRAFDTRRGKKVALQVILPAHPHPEGLAARLEEHVQVLKGLSQPNIAALLDYGEYDGLLCLVYDFSPNRFLRRRFHQKMRYGDAGRVLIPVAQAISYAHQQGVPHGSLRPENILLDQDGNLTLFDFGLENLIVQEILAETPGCWLGSSGGYAAPEQVLGQPPTPAADIYSLGMVYFDLVYGQKIFTAETQVDELIASCYDPVPEIGRLVKDMPRPVQMVFEKCLARDPRQRFADMDHFLTLLKRIALGYPLTKEMVSRPDWQPRPKLSKLAWMGIAIGVVFLAAAAALAILRPEAVFVFGPQPDPTPSLALAVRGNQSTPTSLPTGTPVVEEPAAPAEKPRATRTPSSTPLPKSNLQSLPVFANTLMPSGSQIRTNNATKLLNLARWGGGSLTDLAWSTDGQFYAIATSIGVFGIDAASFETRFYLDTSGWVSSVALSPDGQRAATGEKNGLVRVWDISSGQELLSLGGHLGQVNRVEFSPDGQWLASASADGAARLWDLGLGESALVIKDHVGELRSVDFSPDGKTLATGGLDFKLKLWDLPSGQLRLTIDNPAPVLKLQFSSDGKWIYTALGNMTIRLWDAGTGASIKGISGISTTIASFALSPDDRLIAVGDAAGKVYLWNREGALLYSFLNAGLLRNTGQNFFYANQVAFSPDSTRLSSGIWDHTIRVWNTATGAEEVTSNKMSEFNLESAFSPDSAYLAVQSSDGFTKVWDVAKNKVLYSVPGYLVSGKIFSYDSRYLALKVDANSLKVIKLGTGEQAYFFKGHQSVESISFSSDGDMLVSGVDRDLHVWSLVSDQEIITVRNYDYDGCNVAGGTFSPAIVFGTRFGYLDFIDTKMTKFCPLIKVGWMKDIAYQPSGLTVAGGASKLEVWMVYDEKDKHDMDMPLGDQVERVIISPSEDWVAAAMSDYSIRLWGIDDKSEIVRLIAHGGKVTSLSVSPNGRYLASTSQDGTVRIWGIQ